MLGSLFSWWQASPLSPLPPPSLLPGPLPPLSPRGSDRRACNLVPFARLEQHLPPSPGTQGSHPKPYKKPKTNPGPHANTRTLGTGTRACSTHPVIAQLANQENQTPLEVPTTKKSPRTLIRVSEFLKKLIISSCSKYHFFLLTPHDKTTCLAWDSIDCKIQK